MKGHQVINVALRKTRPGMEERLFPTVSKNARFTLAPAHNLEDNIGSSFMSDSYRYLFEEIVSCSLRQRDIFFCMELS